MQEEKSLSKKFHKPLSKYGFPIEEVGVGGKVVFVEKEQVDFMRDIMPFFNGTIGILVTFLVYQLTGNLMSLVWLTLTYSIYNQYVGLDEAHD